MDLVAVAIATTLGYASRFGWESAQLPDFAFAMLMPLLWVGIAAANRAYDLRFVGFGSAEFGRVGRTFMHVVAATTFISYAADLELARGFIVVTLPLALLLILGARSVIRLRLHRLRRSGRAMDRVVVVGRATSVAGLIAAMRRDRSAGLLVVGACLPSAEAADVEVLRQFDELGVPIVGDLGSVRSAVDECGAGSVAVVAGDVGSRNLRTMSWSLENSGVDLIVSTGLTDVVASRVQLQAISGVPLLRVDTPRYSGPRHVFKAMFDRTAAALALIVLAPFMLTIGLLVRLTSRGPALYFQQRIGRDGMPFRMVKFRSMHVGADNHLRELLDRNETDGVLFKMRDDPRVTRVGKFLRRFSLDELPQLINVLTGSMSLVGPRPPLPSEVAMYEGDVQRRLLVKPGLTGLWQVSGRSDLSWEESVRLDLHYVENWSLGTDLLLLLKTAGVVVKATGAY